MGRDLVKKCNLVSGPQMDPRKLPARSNAAMVFQIFRIQIERGCVWILTGKTGIAWCILDEHCPRRSSEFAEERCFAKGGLEKTVASWYFLEQDCHLAVHMLDSSGN